MSIEEAIGIGFGTAGLGGRVFESVSIALDAGFRKFDTAEEHDYWYDQVSVGRALSNFFSPELTQECIVGGEDVTCPSFCRVRVRVHFILIITIRWWLHVLDNSRTVSYFSAQFVQPCNCSNDTPLLH